MTNPKTAKLAFLSAILIYGTLGVFVRYADVYKRQAQDGLINFELLADGRVDGKLARRLFIEVLAKLLAHRAALGQRCV